MDRLNHLLPRIEKLLDRLEDSPTAPIDWKNTNAARWMAESRSLRAISHPHRIEAKHLLAIDEQKQKIDANTRQFVEGRPANNVLLTGARGTGKSSLVKTMLAKYAGKGLRLVEVDKAGLAHLPELFDLLPDGPQRFILFCDDLSFTADEPGYPALKAALDGSLSSPADNVLIYATSNRRHLMPEYMAENLEARHIGGEVHPGEATEEKVSLSERFGLWVSFLSHGSGRLPFHRRALGKGARCKGLPVGRLHSRGLAVELVARRPVGQGGAAIFAGLDRTR